MALIAAATRYLEICPDICCKVLRLYPDPVPLLDIRLSFATPNTITDLQQTLNWMNLDSHQRLTQFIVNVNMSARMIVTLILKNQALD